MIVDERLERAYQRIRLVKGAGDPGKRKLCVMSFVAYLAGEGHTDRPATASPLIREFVVRVNDAMPMVMRQELKPFAVRIIGTNDGRDAQRAALLREAMEREIVPRARVDFRPRRGFIGWWRAARYGESDSWLRRVPDGPSDDADPLSRSKLAVSTASLLRLCASAAPEAAARAWYWNKAIELLDRLCDIAEERPSPTVDEPRLRGLEGNFGRGERVLRAAGTIARTAVSVRAIVVWPPKGT